MLKILNVAIREFAATVFTRAFVLAMILPPVIMTIAFTLMPILMNKAAPRVEGHIAIIDKSGLVASRVADSFTPEAIRKRREERFKKAMDEAPIPAPLKRQADAAGAQSQQLMGETLLEVRTLDSAADVETEKKPILEASGKDKSNAVVPTDTRLVLAIIPKDSVSPEPGAAYKGFELFTAPRLDPEVQNDIERQISRAIVDARIDSRGMKIDDVRAMTSFPPVSAKAVTDKGDRAASDVARMLIPGAFLMLMWISVFTCGQYLLTSTIEEKSSRVMEVLLSAVSPLQLMTGKIFGQMCVGLLILVVYAGAGIAGLVFASLMHIIDLWNLVYLALYFVIAFALVASLMAAVGSAVSDIREAQSLMGPVMIVLIIPMILWMPIMRNPNSMFAQVCSFVPPISPFIMVLRLAGSEPIPTWQIPASIIVGFISVAIALWAAAKIFRIGVLMYGKPPNFRTLLHWVRMA